MRASARNVIPGTVTAVKAGQIAAEVVIEVTPGVEIVSVITRESAEKLKLKPGSRVKAMLKATSVMVASE